MVVHKADKKVCSFWPKVSAVFKGDLSENLIANIKKIESEVQSQIEVSDLIRVSDLIPSI